MGISSLLKFLRPLAQPCSIAKYKGRCVGIDAMCWMHRGAVASASDILLKGEPGPEFIGFVMKMVKMVRCYGVQPILVFDGETMPLKAAEDASRKLRRETAAKAAKQLLEQGLSMDNLSVRRQAVTSIRVTKSMIRRVMLALQKANIAFLVAPYEADAQLAYLCRQGIVDAVISEDSDLLAYGCPRVLFKLNALGEAQEIDLTAVPFSLAETKPQAETASMNTGRLIEKADTIPAQTCTETAGTTQQASGATVSQPFSTNLVDTDLDQWVIRKPWSPTPREKVADSSFKLTEPVICLPEKAALIEKLAKMTFGMFLAMCILAGSDYTGDVHVQGLGLQSALTLVRRYRTLHGVFHHLTRNPKWKKRLEEVDVQNSSFFHVLPVQNMDSTELVRLRHVIAEFVFANHAVYDPLSNQLTTVGATTPRCAPQLRFQNHTLEDIHIPWIENGVDDSARAMQFMNAIRGSFDFAGATLFFHISGEKYLQNANVQFSAKEEDLITTMRVSEDAHILAELRRSNIAMQQEAHRKSYERLVERKIQQPFQTAVVESDLVTRANNLERDTQDENGGTKKMASPKSFSMQPTMKRGYASRCCAFDRPLSDTTEKASCVSRIKEILETNTLAGSLTASQPATYSIEPSPVRGSSLRRSFKEERTVSKALALRATSTLSEAVIQALNTTPETQSLQDPAPVPQPTRSKLDWMSKVRCEPVNPSEGSTARQMKRRRQGLSAFLVP